MEAFPRQRFGDVLFLEVMGSRLCCGEVTASTGGTWQAIASASVPNPLIF
ncbi:hypothetical protein NG799_19855 [Laspinema sp. D1]|uniref:Uncharacterized protein n=1 Tax=Laspinema palackyanum D2a TaxID=2953684 RepID=A0ABT2MXF0_9CYAN|nr:hypothetical protein [Laspinema sp. D2a]